MHSFLYHVPLCSFTTPCVRWLLQTALFLVHTPFWEPYELIAISFLFNLYWYFFFFFMFLYHNSSWFPPCFWQWGLSFNQVALQVSWWRRGFLYTRPNWWHHPQGEVTRGLVHDQFPRHHKAYSSPRQAVHPPSCPDAGIHTTVPDSITLSDLWRLGKQKWFSKSYI